MISFKLVSFAYQRAIRPIKFSFNNNPRFYKERENRILQLQFPDGTEVQRIGRGTFSDVFKVTPPQKKPVALKVTKNNENCISANKAEATLLSTLSHGNVIPLLGTCLFNNGEHFGSYFPYYEHTLYSYFVKEKKTPDAIRFYELGTEILNGLAYLHEKSIIHRDLKPENIGLVISEQGLKAVILDLNSSEKIPIDRSPKDYMDYVQTRWNRAPEVVIGDRSLYGPPMDIWSVGTILVELVTGTPPFAASRNSTLADYYIHHLGRPQDSPFNKYDIFIWPKTDPPSKDKEAAFMDIASQFEAHGFPPDLYTSLIRNRCFQYHPAKRASATHLLEAFSTQKTLFNKTSKV